MPSARHSRSGDYRFFTTCVDCPGLYAGDDINDMVDRAKEISRATFLKYVDREQMRKIEESLGYATAGRGLRISQDYHVRYGKSTLRGKPVVYFDHSRIEHIFVPPTNN